MNAIAGEILNWEASRPVMLIVVNRAIRNLGNDYKFTGRVDNVILDAIKTVIKKMFVNCKLQLDQETLHQKSQEFASKVICDRFFVINNKESVY